MGTGNQRPFSGFVTYLARDFFNGQRTNVNRQLSWKPSRNFILNLDYDWNDVELPQGDLAAAREPRHASGVLDEARVDHAKDTELRGVSVNEMHSIMASL